MKRAKIQENTRVPVALSTRQRDLIIHHTLADQSLLRALELKPDHGDLIARLTLYDIEKLAGYVAAEANHTSNRGLAHELHALFNYLDSEMNKYDDGNWQ